jgi:MFS family permease
LTCENSIKIGYIGSSFFVGTFIGSFILPRAADIVGRKPMFILGLIIYIFALIGLKFANNYNELLGLLVLSGIGEAGRYYVAYVYVIEIFPNKD